MPRSEQTAFADARHCHASHASRGHRTSHSLQMSSVEVAILSVQQGSIIARKA